MFSHTRATPDPLDNSAPNGPLTLETLIRILTALLEELRELLQKWEVAISTSLATGTSCAAQLDHFVLPQSLLPKPGDMKL